MRDCPEVAAELGICVETLKSWLKRAGFQPGATDRQNRIDKRQRELKAEIRSLRKQLAEKDEVIDVLKKSVGIFLGWHKKTQFQLFIEIEFLSYK